MLPAGCSPIFYCCIRKDTIFSKIIIAFTSLSREPHSNFHPPAPYPSLSTTGDQFGSLQFALHTLLHTYSSRKTNTAFSPSLLGGMVTFVICVHSFTTTVGIKFQYLCSLSRTCLYQSSQDDEWDHLIPLAYMSKQQQYNASYQLAPFLNTANSKAP